MDRTTPEQSLPSSNPERQQLITNITARDRQAFADWLSVNPSQPRLDLPDEAIRVLIPPRLYDFVDDPLSVKIRTIESSEKSLDFYIVEEKDEPITSVQSLQEYTHAADEAVRAKQPIPPLPADVDIKHFDNRELLKDKVGMNDKILLTFSFTQLGSNELFVDSYDDRPELQGNDIGRNAYEGLRDFARQIGEHYISGENREDIINYFTNKLGRIRLSDLSSGLKEIFFKTHDLDMNDPEDVSFSQGVTIDFLYPEEKPEVPSSDAP